MKVTTTTGVVLDFGHEWAKGLTEYAARKGLVGYAAAHATHPDGSQEYLLIQGQEPVYASPSYEAVGVRIDVLTLAGDAAPPEPPP